MDASILEYLNRIISELDMLKNELKQLRTEFAARVSSYDAILGFTNGAYRIDRRLEKLQDDVYRDLNALKQRVDRLGGTVGTLKWVVPLAIAIISLMMNATRIIWR